MGGSVGGAINKVGNSFKTANFGDYLGGGFIGGPLLHGLTGKHFGSGYGLIPGREQPQPGIGGPFSLDQAQFDADRAAINAEGTKQYDQTIKGIGDISTANTQRAKDLFGQMLPDIAENSQAAHLYDSTGYGNEVARQQSSIASQVANDEAQKKFGALSGLQGYQNAALSRGLSLEDFINQANVAKTIGAQMAPQVPSGKGSAVSGLGAGAAAGSPFGPWGSAAGAGLGYLAGGGRGK